MCPLQAKRKPIASPQHNACSHLTPAFQNADVDVQAAHSSATQISGDGSGGCTATPSQLAPNDQLISDMLGMYRRGAAAPCVPSTSTHASDTSPQPPWPPGFLWHPEHHFEMCASVPHIHFMPSTCPAPMREAKFSALIRIPLVRHASSDGTKTIAKSCTINVRASCGGMWPAHKVGVWRAEAVPAHGSAAPARLLHAACCPALDCSSDSGASPRGSLRSGPQCWGALQCQQYHSCAAQQGDVDAWSLQVCSATAQRGFVSVKHSALRELFCKRLRLEDAVAGVPAIDEQHPSTSSKSSTSS